MERAIAIKKLSKILGKSLGYRIDPTAPSGDARAEARLQLKEASVIKSELNDKMTARRKEIIAGDTQYQRLKSDYEKYSVLTEELLSISNHYKITVGTSSSLFFTVRAQGDSWEDVIAKLTPD